jgi:microcystin degradation protein MlrC
MRVAVSSLFHEGNSFSRLITGAANFAVVRGEALLAKARQSSSSLGGACRTLSRLDGEVVAGVSAVTPPGGPVDDAFYRDLREEIVAGLVASRPDGVYLDLHGAMITTALDDPEGDLIGAIRTAMGPDVRIAVSLDLHAHLTPAMLSHADIVVACKENPHTDYALAGERAAELLVARLRGEIAPVTAAIWLPFIFGAQMETGRGPLAELHRRRREIMAEQPGLLDISIYNCTTLVDVEHGWQCVTAIADGDPQAAQDAVAELARLFWSQRAAFTPDFAPLDVVLADIEAGRLATPVILGDQGDRVLAGAAGDGTTIIRKLATQWPGLKAVVPVTDPEVAALARSAGIGADLEASIGGRLSRGVEPFAGRWHVRHLSDGCFIQAGPYLENEPATLGPTAVLESGNLTLLVTSLPGFTQDPEAFRSQGIDLGAQHVVVAKSGYHFKISFAEIGPCVVVDTPGISNYRPGLLPFAQRRLVYPEDDVPEPDFVARLFDRTTVSAAG